MQKFVNEGKVTIHLQTATEEIIASDGRVTAVNAVKAGEPVTFDTDGVFVFVGLLPNTQFLEGSGIELDERGLIKTDDHLRTNIKGVFASGDVRSGATMQIASAVGEGASAALSIREYLEDYNRDPSEI
jgi:thioredoxin reductase (NADPH)